MEPKNSIKVFHTFLSILLVSLSFGLFYSCEKKNLFKSSRHAAPAKTQVVLGTVCSINLFEGGSEKNYELVFSRLRQLEQIFSVNLAYSEVSQVNAAAGLHPVEVSTELFFVAEKSLYYAQASGGLFDPTIGPLVKLWGINTPGARIPSDQELEETLPLVNWQNVVLDKEKKTIFLKEKGMSLDFGAIAKGYAADELIPLISKMTSSALIDLGGNVYLYGKKDDGSLWQVGIRNPLARDGVASALTLDGNLSAVTSGPYERFMEVGGTEFHHILNPKTGRPAETGLLSLTVISTSSVDADALSTTLFLLGPRKCPDFLKNFPPCEVVFIDENRAISYTKALSGKIRIINPDFHF